MILLWRGVRYKRTVDRRMHLLHLVGIDSTAPPRNRGRQTDAMPVLKVYTPSLSLRLPKACDCLLLRRSKSLVDTGASGVHALTKRESISQHEARPVSHARRPCGASLSASIDRDLMTYHDLQIAAK